ncbi:MAG: hypothetical protein ACOCXT_06865 [Candidatus Dojkabacteria bacterium]
MNGEGTAPYTLVIGAPTATLPMAFEKTTTLSTNPQLVPYGRGLYKGVWYYSSDIQTTGTCRTPESNQPKAPCGNPILDTKSQGKGYGFMIKCQAKSESGVQVCDRIVRNLKVEIKR